MVVEGPGGARLHAVVFRPSGDGPFPVVLILHGSQGLHRGYGSWSPNFATAGFLTVMGCWFGTSQGEYPCPQVPALGAQNLQATRNVMALIDAGRRLAGARRERVGLVGNSLGGGLAALAAASGPDVQGVVSISGSLESAVSRNDPAPISVVQALRAPVLILHGTRDVNVPVREARAYEDRARRLGKVIQSHYYEGGDHGLPWSPQFGEDVFRRSVEFLNQYLR